MKTGEPGLPARAVLPSEATFRALQQPQRRLAAHADPWRRYPNRALAVPSARKARARLTDLEEENGNVGAIEPQTLT